MLPLLSSCSYALAGIHDNFTLIPHTVPCVVPSLTTDTSIATSTYPIFIATSANSSANHMTVRDYAPMSSMSPIVHIFDESASQAAVMLWLEFMTTSLSFLIQSLLQFQV